MYIDSHFFSSYGEGIFSIGNFESIDVTSIEFHFIEFDSILPLLPKLNQRFANLRCMRLSANNITHLSQINRLQCLKNIYELDISKEGNPVVSLPIFKKYLLFYLSHLPLEKVGKEHIYMEDRELARHCFGKEKRVG